jgi:hypothetical protein
MWLTLQQQFVMCTHYVGLCLQGRGHRRIKTLKEIIPAFTLFLNV